MTNRLGVPVLALLLASCSGGGGGGGPPINVAATWPAFLGRWFPASTEPTLVMVIQPNNTTPDRFFVDAIWGTRANPSGTECDGSMTVESDGLHFHFISDDQTVRCDGEMFQDQASGTRRLNAEVSIASVLGGTPYGAVFDRIASQSVLASWSWPDLDIGLRVEMR